MAHFVNHKGSRISQSILHTTPGSAVIIGVWGAAGLRVGPNDPSMASIKNLGADKNNNTWFQLQGQRVGYVMVEAKMNDAVWDFFQLAVVDGPKVFAPNPDGKYTTNPNEVRTESTKTTPTALMGLLASIPELTDAGKRNLIAQHMHETGGGKSCFNWNLGNVRTDRSDVPHMYLRDVGEYLSPSAAQAALEAGRADGTARPPTAEEKKRWTARPGVVVVMFNPPNEGARFRAFTSLAEGGQSLVAKYRRVGAGHSDFFPALNRSDFDAIAHILWLAHYFTGSEAVYAARMREWRGVIDGKLGGG